MQYQEVDECEDNELAARVWHYCRPTKVRLFLGREQPSAELHDKPDEVPSGLMVAVLP